MNNYRGLQAFSGWRRVLLSRPYVFGRVTSQSDMFKMQNSKVRLDVWCGEEREEHEEEGIQRSKSGATKPTAKKQSAAAPRLFALTRDSTATIKMSSLLTQTSSSEQPAVSSNSNHHHRFLTDVFACCYVLSGVAQPIIMTFCRDAGLANPIAQLYMVFYYFGPALLLIFTVRSDHPPWPSLGTSLKACGIAIWDICAGSMNYTGASLAGPSIFSIIYASVSVWTAVWAWFLLGRRHGLVQWISVSLVFAGLAMTASDSLNLAPAVIHGTVLVLFGSAMHGGSYVMCEAIMSGQDGLSVLQNSGLQGLVAMVLLLSWQFIYTAPRWDEIIGEPAKDAGTSLALALGIMMAFAVANLVHSFTFFFTIKHKKGGSVMAGVLKGLQAVLVFVVTHFLFCGRTGGNEMCFSRGKFFSLVTVVSGVMLFSWSTNENTPTPRKQGYAAIEGGDDDVIIEAN